MAKKSVRRSITMTQEMRDRLALLVWRDIGGDEIDAAEVVSGLCGAGGGNMAAVHGVESPTEDGNVHCGPT